MFLSLDIIHKLISIITSLITYFWLIPVLGCFRAWVAKKTGDDTPEMLGFLTLDPFAHADMIGLIVLVILENLSLKKAKLLLTIIKPAYRLV